jgi:hypothetical protein
MRALFPGFGQYGIDTAHRECGFADRIIGCIRRTSAGTRPEVHLDQLRPEVDADRGLVDANSHELVQAPRRHGVEGMRGAVDALAGDVAAPVLRLSAGTVQVREGLAIETSSHARKGT